MGDEGPARKQKRERPRDELGRPLPYGTESLLHLEDYDALDVEENHRLGVEHFNAGRFFPAHEAWESAWKQAKGTDEEEFFKGLSQLGAGYTHYLRRNAHGARTLLRRGIRRVVAYGPRHRGVDIGRLARAVAADAEAIEAAEQAGDDLPLITPPTLVRLSSKRRSSAPGAKRPRGRRTARG